MGNEFLTLQQAAELLGVSRRRVRQLVEEGRLPITRVGATAAIAAADLDLVRVRQTGRPKKDLEIVS